MWKGIGTMDVNLSMDLFIPNAKWQHDICREVKIFDSSLTENIGKKYNLIYINLTTNMREKYPFFSRRGS